MTAPGFEIEFAGKELLPGAVTEALRIYLMESLPVLKGSGGISQSDVYIIGFEELVMNSDDIIVCSPPGEDDDAPGFYYDIYSSAEGETWPALARVTEREDGGRDHRHFAWVFGCYFLSLYPTRDDGAQLTFELLKVRDG